MCITDAIQYLVKPDVAARFLRRPEIPVANLQHIKIFYLLTFLRAF